MFIISRCTHGCGYQIILINRFNILINSLTYVSLVTLKKIYESVSFFFYLKKKRNYLRLQPINFKITPPYIIPFQNQFIKFYLTNNSSIILTGRRTTLERRVHTIW